MPYFARKIVQLAGTLLAVTFLTFLMLDLLPGGPEWAPCLPAPTEACLEAEREKQGLNDPIPVRYAGWLANAATGDLGASHITDQPVWEAMTQRLPVTLELLIYSQLLALGIAVPAGLMAARHPDGWFDRASSGAAFVLFAMPNYVLALLLVLLFAVTWQIFPATGYVQLTEDLPGSILGNLQSLFLPAFALGAAQIAVYLRLLRGDLIATLQEDYITLARAKGLTNRRILLRHAFRPSTFSLVTVAGLNMGSLIGGAVVIEVVFALNGLGGYLVTAVFRRDFIAVQGAVLVVTVGYVLINFAVDLFYGWIDPRVRARETAS